MITWLPYDGTIDNSTCKEIFVISRPTCKRHLPTIQKTFKNYAPYFYKCKELVDFLKVVFCLRNLINKKQLRPTQKLYNNILSMFIKCIVYFLLYYKTLFHYYTWYEICMTLDLFLIIHVRKLTFLTLSLIYVIPNNCSFLFRFLWT